MNRGAAVRLAVGPEGVTVIGPDGQVRSAPVPDDPRATFGEGVASGITQVLDGVESGPVHWALLPRVADVRRVRLPPLNADRTTDVLTRHAARYFPSARGEQALAWRLVERPRGAPVELLAAAADAGMVDAARSAIDTAGFEPRDPIPAVEAWVVAALANRPEAAVVLVAGGRQVVLIAVEDTRAVDIAMLPANLPDRVVSRIRDWTGDGPIVVLGNGGSRQALLAGLRSKMPAGYELHEGRPEDAAVLAARFADAGGLPLVTSEVRAERKARGRRRAAWLWAAATLLVVLAGVLELWGLNRELALVDAERRERAAAVADALGRRHAIDERRTMIAALDSLERTAPAWAGLVSDLALHLPDDAYLEALRGRPDSLAIDGVANDAAGVFAALRAVPGVREIQALAPIRRQVVDGTAAERFSLAARVGPVVSTVPENVTTDESKQQGAAR